MDEQVHKTPRQEGVWHSWKNMEVSVMGAGWTTRGTDGVRSQAPGPFREQSLCEGRYCRVLKGGVTCFKRITPFAGCRLWWGKGRKKTIIQECNSGGLDWSGPSEYGEAWSGLGGAGLKGGNFILDMSNVKCPLDIQVKESDMQVGVHVWELNWRCKLRSPGRTDLELNESPVTRVYMEKKSGLKLRCGAS